MAQPFSYMLNVPNPAEAVIGGVQQGMQLGTMMERADAMAAQRRQTEIETALTMQKAQREQAQREAIAKFYDTPAEQRTPAMFEALAGTLPKELADNMRTAFDARTKEQQRQDLLFGGQIFSALRSGDRATAHAMMKKRADALRSAGDEAQATAFENAAEMAQNAPDQAEMFVGTQLSVLPGGKEFLENVTKQSELQRNEALFKPKLAEEQAKAEIEGIKRDFFAEGERARIDLLKAQAGAQRASAYKSSREASGSLTPEKKFEFEEKLRSRYEGNSKEFRQISDAYSGIKSTGGIEASPIARVAKIFSFVKMIDPGSVVRDNDFEALRNTRGFALSPDWFKQEVDRVATGAPIKDDTVRQINAAAAERYKAARARDTAARGEIDAIAKEYGLDTRNLFISPQEKTDEEERAVAQPGPVMTPAQPQATKAAPANVSLGDGFTFRGRR